MRKQPTFSLHEQLAVKVLRKTARLARQAGLQVFRDDWPFHIVVTDGTHRVSIWCGDFDKHLETMPLNFTGTLGRAIGERVFQTPRGAPNCHVSSQN